MSAHAVEEMAEDYLDIDDVEHVLLTGVLHRIERDDPRGTKYVVHGTAWTVLLSLVWSDGLRARTVS